MIQSTKKTLRIAFRVDASVEIGTGHVMRCLTLADALRQQGHECRFICRAHPGHLGDVITQKGFILHVLDAPETQAPQQAENPQLAHSDWLGCSWQYDVEQTLACLANERPDWLVVDHYALDARWERRVLSGVGRIMVIDDLADREHECAVLLDQNLGRKTSDYDHRVPAHCQRLIGPEFALLRHEFAEWRETSLARRRQHPELKHVLVNLGGVDKDNVTGQVLEALTTCELPGDTRITVIMGGTAPWLEEVKVKAEALPWPTEVAVSVNDMARRMVEADLAIGAAGSTSWERCCLGLPTLMVVLAENQREIADVLETIGAAVCIEHPQKVKELQGSLIALRDSEKLQKMSASAAQVTQGAGTNAICQVMLATIYKKSVN